MPYSAHRSGRLDSQGRIVFDGETEELDFVGGFEPTGSDADLGDAEIADQRRASPDPAPVVAEPADDRETAKSRLPRTPRAPGSRLRRLAILGDAEGEILDRVPGETPRFVQMFFVLAGTAFVSAISMISALTTGVGAAIWLAVSLAIVWALIIFNFDWFLTSTMTSTTNILRIVGPAIPRSLMVAVTRFVVAAPLVLQIFHNDIAREVAATNIVQAQSDQDAPESGPEKRMLDAASGRVAALEDQVTRGIVAGNGSTSASESAAQATVDDLTAKMTTHQGVIDQPRTLYQCELIGDGPGTVSGCTGANGEGASSAAAQAQQSYHALAEQLRVDNEQLAAAGTAARENTSASESPNREDAQRQLPAARTTYGSALAAYNVRADAVAQGNAGAVGLLGQISVLGRLAEREPAIL